MADILEIFGTEYTGVTGIIATDNNNTEKTYIRPQGTKTISTNGTGINVAEYATVDVNVAGGGSSISLQTKNKTYTPTESQQTQSIAADSGYDGLSQVNVTVNAVSSTYIGSGIDQRSSTNLTASGATVTVPAGYYASAASKSVATGQAGTPVATKGTVSNHAISVTPSVTNTTGYITGGTKTGTAVSVAASELVSGTLTINSSGTKDVTNYASASVATGTVTAPSSISGTSASVSTGTNTLTLSKTVSVTPSVTTAGYVSSGTAGNATVSLTATISTRSSSDLTVSDATVIAPAGYYGTSASKSVASGTAGTPIATKGTVSNHSVSITPSVTNTTGYITGSTKTGTAVSVSASELVSGTLNIADNGTSDVTNYASVNVAIPFVTYYTGTTNPSSSLGSNNDIYLKVVT